MVETGFWRTEIWHPLSVHYPIALLIVATLMKLIALILKKGQKETWQKAGSALLYAGCLAAWVSIYTGNMADSIVARKICDPTVLKSHQIAANNVAYLFSAAVIIDLMVVIKLIRNKLLFIARYFIILLMLAGTGYLIYAGHLGATLVYQQGAGVHKPALDCSDY